MTARLAREIKAVLSMASNCPAMFLEMETKQALREDLGDFHEVSVKCHGLSSTRPELRPDAPSPPPAWNADFLERSRPGGKLAATKGARSVTIPGLAVKEASGLANPVRNEALRPADRCRVM